MSKRYDCRDPQERIAGIEAAVTAARAGELIVLPTDTVYGIGADAFTTRRRSPPCWRPRAAAGTCRRRCSSARRGPRRHWWTTWARSGRT